MRATAFRKPTSSGISVASIHVLVCTLLISAGFIAYILIWQYKYVFIGFLGALLVTLVLAGGRGIRVDRIAEHAIPMVSFFAYLGLSLLWSADLELAGEAYLYNLIQLVVLAVFLVMGRNAEPRDINRFFVVYTITCLAMSAYVYAVQGAFRGDVFASIRTTFGLILATAVPFLLWGICERPIPIKWALLLIVLFTIAVLGSRAAFLVAPAVLLASLYWLGPRTVGHRLAVGVGAIVTVSVIAASLIAEGDFLQLSAASFSLDMSSDVEEGKHYLHPDYRVDLERRLMTFSVLEDLAENPWFGTGYMGTYLSTLSKYRMGIPAHGLLALFAEAGIVGISLFVWALATFWRLTKPEGSCASYLVALRLGMLAFLGIGLFHPVLESPTLFIIYGLGCGMGCRNAQARTRGAEKPAYSLSTSKRSEVGPDEPSALHRPAR